MKKAVSLVILTALALGVAGCGKTEAGAEYGEEVFSCNTDNLLGFEGLYIDDDTVTMLFDEEYVEDDHGYNIPGVENVFEAEEFFVSNYHIYLYCGDDSFDIEASDIDVDADDMTISFECDDIDSQITGFCLRIGANYFVDFNEGTIKVDRAGGDCFETYIQEYNFTRDRWGDIEYTVTPCPETCIEPDVDPGVQPSVQPAIVTGDIIIPYLAELDEDEFVPENNQYLYGMVDTEGNIVYEPVFSSCSYINECGAYIVGGFEDGKMQYGLMRSNGSDFTGFIYDGAYYEKGTEEGEPGHFNMTTYSEGNLHVTYYDGSLNTAGELDITIDESALPYDAADGGLTLLHADERAGGAVIENRNEFYPQLVLIDITTGGILHYFEYNFGNVTLFGDIIIEADRAFNGVSVYDYTGECTLDDPDGIGKKLSDSDYMIVTDGMLYIVDLDADNRAQMEISPNAVVDTAMGIIAVCENGCTTFYDYSLNEVDVEPGVNIDNGYLPGKFNDDWYGGIIFVSFGDDTVTNFITGSSMPSDEGYFYSYEAGYVIADNRGDGNTLDHRIRVYDENLNLILEVEGYGDTFTDEVTGEHYLSYISDGVTTVFSLDRCEEMFTLDGDCGYYVTRAYDGAFVLTDRDNYNIYDPDGEVVFSCSINR